MVSMSMSWRLVVFLVVIASCEFGGGERWRDSRAVAVKNMQNSVLMTRQRRDAQLSCPEDRVSSGGKGSFIWPQTLAGQSAKAPCERPKGDNKMTFAARGCNITGVWLPVDNSRCQYLSDTTANLDHLHQMPLNHDNVRTVAAELTNLTIDYNDFASFDIDLSVGVVENVIKVGHSDNDVSFSVSIRVAMQSLVSNRLTVQALVDLITTASQLFQLDQVTLEEAEAYYNTSLRLVAAIESVARQYDLSIGSVSVPVIETSQISMDMVEVTQGNYSGITFHQSRSSADGRYQRRPSRSFHSGAQDKNDVEVGIELPTSVLDHVIGATSESSVRVNFVTYEANNLFVDSSLSSGNRVDNNTKVISAFVGNSSVYNLTSNATIVFAPLQPGYAPQCVYWDNSINDGFGGWKSDGCILVQNTKDYVSCECNHLTSFSVIFSLCNGNCPCESVSDKALSFISYVGCSLSMLGLLLTIVCILAAKCHRGQIMNSSHITVNFCIALLLAMVVFTTVRTAVSLAGACTAVAALLHFLLLSTFLWLMMEGMCIYRDLVVAMGIDQSSTKFRNTAYAIVWGSSALVVVILLAIQEISSAVAGGSSDGNSTNVTGSSGHIEIYGVVEVYRDDDSTEVDLSYCWITNTGVFLGMFAVPALTIVWLNFFIIIRVYFVLRTRSKTQARMTTRRDKTDGGRRMKGMIMVSLNLGATWLLGAATLVDYQGFFPDADGPGDVICSLLTVFQYLFAVSNSLLGFLIFLFNVLLNNRIRHQLMSRLQIRYKPEQQKPVKKEHKGLTLKFLPKLLTLTRSKGGDKAHFDLSADATTDSDLGMTTTHDDDL